MSFFQFHVADSRKTLSLEDEFNKRSFPSLVRSLQWQSGLDYVLATTQSEVCSICFFCLYINVSFFYLKIMKIPLEECSSNTYCSSCVGSSNPLCGWCISENKCSRVSKCRDGNSTSSIMWISSNPNTPYCIIPDRMVLNNREQVTRKQQKCIIMNRHEKSQCKLILIERTKHFCIFEVIDAVIVIQLMLYYIRKK